MPVLLLIVCINFVGVGALIPILPYTILESMGLPASVMTMLRTTKERTRADTA